MRTYQLFLDESGQFKENNSNGKRKQDPSIVGGYLALNKNCNTYWAKKLLKKIKESTSAFSNISIDPFHGMKTADSNLSAFITSLLQELCSDERVCLVEFKNERGLDIVNSDITYLNVLTEGIIQLILGLMKETDNEIHLDIDFAQRVDVTQKEESNKRIIQYINQKEYKDRLEERLVLQLEALPKHIQNRFSYDIQCGNANTDAVLMIAGKGELAEYLRSVCEALRITESVIFPGFEENVYRYMKRADVFVLPSGYEGFPNVIGEAMCCGCPVVATDFAGVRDILAPELVSHNESVRRMNKCSYGIITPKCSGKKYSGVEPLEAAETELADAITEILTNNALRDQYCCKSLERAGEYTIERTVEKWIEVIES